MLWLFPADDPERRRPRGSGCRLHPRLLGRAADPAGPLLDHDGDAAHLPWRARQRQRRPGPVAGDAGRGLLEARLRDGGLRGRVRARRAVGAQSGLPALRRPLRPEEVQAPRPRNRAKTGQRGDGRGPGLAGDPQAGPLLRLDPSLRRPRPLRASRAVPLEVRRKRSRRPLRRRDRVRRRAGGPVLFLAAGQRDRPEDRRRDHGRPRRGAGQPRRGDPRVLRVRLRHARAVPRGDAVRRSRVGSGSTRR